MRTETEIRAAVAELERTGEAVIADPRAVAVVANLRGALMWVLGHRDGAAMQHALDQLQAIHDDPDDGDDWRLAEALNGRR